MKKLMLLIGILAVLLLSCDFLSEGERQFTAQNMITDAYYQLGADNLAVGRYCTIWVEVGSGISETDAKKVADEYDNNIYPKMIQNFGIDFKDGGKTYNTMEYADIDGDGKLTILLLDIKDGYNGITNTAYTAGYFWMGNFFSKDDITGSNECDMIFIDTNPGLKLDPKGTYSTLAHEMQHLMNFITTLEKRGVYDENGALEDFNQMDTWVDEGLSSAAEWVYENDHTSKVKMYNDNSSKLIDKGNNFFVWGNRSNESQYAILDDYSTVYLFFQWLRLQNDSGIYKKIISSPDSNYRAVTSSVTGTPAWSTLLGNWLMANSVNGYRNEPVLKDIIAPYVPNGTTQLPLYPGEGVYSKATSNPYNSSGNIKYSYLSASSTLLTYNDNTTSDPKTAQTATGMTTGVGATASVNEVSNGRSIQSGGPIRLDARDMLIRNGSRQDTFDYPRLTLLNRIRANVE